MISENYIEMCRASEEIQKLNPGCNGVITFLEMDLFIDESGKLFYRHTTYPNGIESRTTSYYFLPRQEDLQAIAIDYLVKEDKKNGRDPKGWENLFLQDRFWNWYREWEDVDFSTLWLMFVMETCYGKRYDTEKKKWVVL